MPRIAGLSGRSITWFSRVNPSPLITCFCFTGEQMAEITHFKCIFPATAFGFFVVIENSSNPRAAVPSYSVLATWYYNSCTVFPRIAATLSRLFKWRSASNVALITLCGLVVPIDFVSTF
jgi:hypothetical protein